MYAKGPASQTLASMRNGLHLKTQVAGHTLQARRQVDLAFLCNRSIQWLLAADVIDMLVYPKRRQDHKVAFT